MQSIAGMNQSKKFPILLLPCYMVQHTLTVLLLLYISHWFQILSKAAFIFVQCTPTYNTFAVDNGPVQETASLYNEWQDEIVKA